MLGKAKWLRSVAAACGCGLWLAGAGTTLLGAVQARGKTPCATGGDQRC